MLSDSDIGDRKNVLAHSALGDVLVTLALLKRMLKDSKMTLPQLHEDIYKPKKITVHPEIQKIDSEIEFIREQMKDLELKLKSFRDQILTKQESKRKFLKNIEKQKLKKKTTRKKGSVKKSTKKRSKKTKK